jgi:hypothetical protein
MAGPQDHRDVAIRSYSSHSALRRRVVALKM